MSSRRVAQRVYDLYGRFYDCFDGIWTRRLQLSLREARFPAGARLLDIGIGTGLTLPYYPPEVHLVGLDLSGGMLEQAQAKIRSGAVRRGPGTTQLIRSNALELPFASEAFDGVLMTHVITTVPDPLLALAEAFRVARDGAQILLVNHFRSTQPLVGWVESILDPVCRRLGWTSKLPLRPLLAAFDVQNVFDPPPTLFQTIHLQKKAGQIRMLHPDQLPYNTSYADLAVSRST